MTSLILITNLNALQTEQQFLQVEGRFRLDEMLHCQTNLNFVLVRTKSKIDYPVFNAFFARWKLFIFNFILIDARLTLLCLVCIGLQSLFSITFPTMSCFLGLYLFFGVLLLLQFLLTPILLAVLLLACRTCRVCLHLGIKEKGC